MNGPEALRWAADRIIGDGRVFDSDHDNALVAARLTELADQLEHPAPGWNYCPESSLVAWGAHLIAEQERNA